MLKLRLLTGPRAGRQLRVSDTKPVSIGRRKGRLRLHDSRVSKNHAEIYFDNDLWLLRDLGSANGTYVNRKKVEGLVELEPGDMVQMGRVLLKIVRCDGIGMDTQPGLSDDLLDDAFGMGAATAESIGGDDDFDLDALFDESPADDPSDGSDALSAIEEPQVPAASETPAEDDVLDAIDEVVPEPIEVAFDEPVDDDDSFFADIGEATDTSDGIDVAVQEELAQDEPQDDQDEADPFLGDQEESPGGDDTSDQISLEDESGMGPRSAGTTLLTSVPHDDLVIGEDEDSGTGFFDDDEPPAHETDDDDEAPAVVGLHLDHAPPQQPEPKTEEVEAEDEVEAKDESEVASAAGSEDAPIDSLPVEDEEQHAEPVSVDDEPDTLEPEEPVAAQLDGSIDEPEEVVEEPVFETASKFEDDGEPESEIEPEPEPEPELKPVPQTIAQTQLSEDNLDDGPEFDIDAAFDALSMGLDDSQETPAIDAATDADSHTEPNLEPSGGQSDIDTPSDPPIATHADEPAPTDALVGTQLDVDFIKDALSKLDESEAADGEPPADDAIPKASAAPAPPPQMPPATPPAEPYLQSPPPGLNPTSLNPPAEPRRASRPHSDGSSKGRWFFSLLLFLCVGGVGGWLISQNYDRLIAGRDDAGAVNPDDSDSPATPTGPIAEQPDPGPTVGEPTSPDPTDSDTTPTQPAGPNPFAAGPVVLGPDALQGLTRGANPDRPLDPTQQSTNTNPQGPGTIVQPSIGPGSSNPSIDPSIDNPQLNPPGTDPPTPVTDSPPARIVFLVDASGSLVDSLPQMVVWLNEALQTIEPDERFAVYFFKADEPIAIKPKGMLAPTRELLNQLSEAWLDPDAVPIFPSGRSNPTKAIAQAMTHNPTDLYLLSDDAFAMSKGGATTAQALDLVTQAIGDQDVRVHGVQFFYRGENDVLETLANQTKGTFEFVRERVVPDAEPIDLLEELEGE